MAHFCPISRSDMAALLEPWGFGLVALPGVSELVWHKVRPDSIEMRVYSGIVGETSRGKGLDAIRVELHWHKDGKVYRIGGSKRVHRVAGWKDNLTARMKGWKELLGPVCHHCGAPMVLREVKKDGPNKGREFYSCCRWRDTNCQGFLWADTVAA